MKNDSDFKKLTIEQQAIEAAREGYLDNLKNLIYQEIELLSFSDSSGCSLLMYACLSNQVEVADFLIRTGFSPNDSDLKGNTLLMGATCHGHFETVQLLLNYGADPLKKNHDGLTASDIAAKFGRIEVLRLLNQATQPGLKEKIMTISCYLKNLLDRKNK